MNTIPYSGFRKSCLILIVCLCCACRAGFAQTFNVTAGDTVNYTIDGQPDPPLVLQRGVTYVFLLSNLSIHPFWIKSSLGFGSTGRYDTGVTNNGVTSVSVTIGVTAGTPDSLFYQCGNHSSMNGTLTVVDPPSPPTVTVVYISVADLITLKSTGTNGNGWSVIPEYNCDFSGTNWTAVPSSTNSFANGTNTTTFDRLDPICGSNIFLRVRNQQN